MHNASRVLSKCFSGDVEKVLDALGHDLDEQVQKSSLQEISSITDIKVLSQKRRAPHRWLSELPVIDEFIEEYDALRLHYSAYVEDDIRLLVDKTVDSILRRNGVTNEGI